MDTQPLFSPIKDEIVSGRSWSTRGAWRRRGLQNGGGSWAWPAGMGHAGRGLKGVEPSRWGRSWAWPVGTGRGRDARGLTSARGGPPAVPEQEASSSSAFICSHPQGHLVAGGDDRSRPKGPTEASEPLAFGSCPSKDLQGIIPACRVLLQVKDSKGQRYLLALRDLVARDRGIGAHP